MHFYNEKMSWNQFTVTYEANALIENMTLDALQAGVGDQDSQIS